VVCPCCSSGSGAPEPPQALCAPNSKVVGTTEKKGDGTSVISDDADADTQTHQALCAL
jgi:hypothetical protein